jgi:hypothetical protein
VGGSQAIGLSSGSRNSVDVDVAPLMPFDYWDGVGLQHVSAIMTTLTDYDSKIDALRRYRKAKGKRRAVIEHTANAPWRATLQMGDEECSFTLSGNEIASLFSEFSDIKGVRDLFADEL